MDKIQAFIYALIDPRTNLVCYIGQSIQGMKRPQTQNRKGSVKAWMIELRKLSLIHTVTVLEYVEQPKALRNHCHWWCGRNTTALNDAERWWIAYGRALGWPLLNQTTGGEGTYGFIPTAETRFKMRKARNRFIEANPAVLWGVALPEVRKRFSGANSPTKRPEVREKLRIANTPRFQDPAMRESNSAQLRGLWKTRRSEMKTALNEPGLIERRRHALKNKNHPIHNARAKVRGKRHPKTRNDISSDAIFALRAMGCGFTHKFIADAFNVSKSYIQKQLHNGVWS